MELFADVVEQYADFAALRARATRPASRRGPRAWWRTPRCWPGSATLPRRQAAAQPGLRGGPLARRAGARAVRRRCARRCSATTARSGPRSWRGPTQTNEVGRLATLVPAFAALSRGPARPLALLEVGRERRAVPLPRPLRLRVADGDRRGHRSRRGGRAEPLACEVTGPAPLPDRAAARWRGAAGSTCTRSTSPTRTRWRWLTTLVWPEHDDRRRRLRARDRGGARAEPPELVRRRPAGRAAGAGRAGRRARPGGGLPQRGAGLPDARRTGTRFHATDGRAWSRTAAATG